MERSGLQCREDLVVLGKATALVLGEDELAVTQHVELALAARDVLRLDPVRVQLGCETRSPLVIARSGGAVVDLDRHCRQRTSQSQKSVTTRWPAGMSGAPGGLPRPSQGPVSSSSPMYSSGWSSVAHRWTSSGVAVVVTYTAEAYGHSPSMTSSI